MSAAALILIASTGVRTMSKNGIMMLHSVSSWVGGTVGDIQVEAKQVLDLNDTICQIISKCSNQSVEYWQNVTKSNFYLNSADAQKLAVIDKVK